MFVIRPVAPHDLDPLLELTASAGHGLTSLAADREYLRKRIARSRRGFEGMGDRPAGESYLFVLEDTAAAGRVAGTSGVVSKVGGFEPFYAFRVETTVHASPALGVRKEIRVLHLVAEHNGPSEIGSLFLAAAHRGGSAGRLLSLSRFLFMADHEQSFDPLVLAEMRGVVDAQGRSPFWEAVGRHFFDVDYPRADRLSAVDKRFIAELMPKHPVYITLLPPEARQVIGQVHEQTRPALRLLESEGFKPTGMVDMFDAGPIVSCPLRDVRVVRESRRATVADTSLPEPAAGTPASEPYLLANGRADFRACVGPVTPSTNGDVRITAACAAALQVGPGDAVRFAPLRPSAASTAPARTEVPAPKEQVA